MGMNIFLSPRRGTAEKRNWCRENFGHEDGGTWDYGWSVPRHVMEALNSKEIITSVFDETGINLKISPEEVVRTIVYFFAFNKESDAVLFKLRWVGK